jgi:hypothetical protein
MNIHAREHVGEALFQTNISQSVLDSIRRLNVRTLRVLAEAEDGETRDPNVALAAIREARHNLTLIGKLTGELKRDEPAEPTRVEVIYVDKQLVVERAEGDKPPSLPPAA